MGLKYALVVACSALALGTAAQAQQTVDSVTGGAASSTSGNGFDGSIKITPGFVSGTGGASNYTSTYDIGKQFITFESGNALSGNSVQTTSVSEIDMTISNHSDGRVAPTLMSQITAAGMGIYIGDNSAGGCFTAGSSCGQSHSARTFQDFTNSGTGFPLAQVAVDFQVVQDDVSIYHVLGALTFSSDGHVFIFNDTGNAEDIPGAHPLTDLNGFTTLDQFGAIDPTTGKSNSALGFAWDATDISVPLNVIGSGSFSNISYIVTVTSLTNANCVGTDCLVAYAGFGDPIGRGGDISSAAFGAFRGFNFSGPSGPDYIKGVNFSPYSLAIPGFDGNGDLILTPTGVPEPASWALAILGFGVLGAALRRRRVPAYT